MTEPLWNYPGRMPAGRNQVEVMEEQAAAIHADSPQYAEAQFELMRAYAQAGRFDDARKVFEILLGLEVPDEAKARAALVVGGWAEGANDYELAAEFYRRVISLDPRAYLGHNNLAYSLNALSRHSEAEEAARVAVEIAPDVYNAHKNLGVALEGEGRYAEAAQSYLASIERQPFERRAFRHLESLTTAHPELLQEVEGLAAQIEYWRKPTMAKYLKALGYPEPGMN